VSTRSSRRRQKTAQWITATLVAVICLLALFTVAIPFALGAQPYTVLTGSMRPALEPGHLIGVRPIDIRDVAPGDIVTFQIRSGQPEVATHRVVGVTRNGHGDQLLITQGDANNAPDAEPVQAVQLRGVVVYAVPWLGRLNMWATPTVKSIVVTAVGIAAIGYGVLVLTRGGTRRRKAAHAAAVCVVAAVAWSSAGAALPARAATDVPPPDALQLSSDGATWTSGGSVILFDGHVFAPGDAANHALWIRNASPDPAQASLRAEWTPTDASDPADTALAAALRATVAGTDLSGATSVGGPALAPGEAARVDLTAALPWETGMDARNGSAALSVTVTLTQSTRSPSPTATPAAAADPPGTPASDLAITGGAVALSGIVVGILAIGIGVAARLLAARNRGSGRHAASGG
jgi:signal peptidase